MLKETLYCERNASVDTRAVDKLAAELSVSPITARILLNRGIRDVSHAESFLYPNRGLLHNPFLLPDMEKAVERIQEAIESEERIFIYGDYDTDGVCATVILYKTLQKMGADVDYFIPDRHKDGYGMHKQNVEELLQKGCDLIITVDNGITAIDEIKLCTDYWTDVIVTDHHLPRALMEGEVPPKGAVLLPGTNKVIPKCVAVVTPSRDDSKYPCRWLCGAGVALKLSVALTGVIDDELLGLACIATVADVVSLTGENRTIVKLGLPYIARNEGIALLLENAGFEGEPDEQTIGFVISPRINAAGRMGNCMRAIRLLVTDDPDERVLLSDELQGENEKRREEETKVLDAIYHEHAPEQLGSMKVIVLVGEGWNPGVLGIASSKLAERFNCPVILFSHLVTKADSEKLDPHTGEVIVYDEKYVGSGRSIRGIHLHDILTPLQHYCTRFGGHAMAVGITIPDKESLNGFIGDLTGICSEIDDTTYIKRIEYDATLSLTDVSMSLYEELASLAPFGEGNPYPVFHSSNLLPVSFRKIGKTGDHLDGVFTASPNAGTGLPFVGFKMGERFENLDSRLRYDALYSLMKDEYRNIISLKAKLVDFQKNDAIQSRENYKKNDAILSREEYNKIRCSNPFSKRFLRPERFETIERRSFSREAMQQSYLRIRGLIGSSTKQDFSVAERIRLCIFLELGHFVFDTTGNISLPKEKIKKPLSESIIYQIVMPK